MMTMSNPNLGASQPNPSIPPTSKANDTARYTPQQEVEMGISDGKGGPKVQPSGAFAMIALTYVFIAAVGVVIVALIMHFSGAGTPATPQ